jgi:hypothetical protein
VSGLREDTIRLHGGSSQRARLVSVRRRIRRARHPNRRLDRGSDRVVPSMLRARKACGTNMSNALETQDRSQTSIHFLLSPRLRKDGCHRNLARSHRDPADRFPSAAGGKRELFRRHTADSAPGGCARRSIRSRQAQIQYPYSGDAPASTPFRCAGLCVDDFETWGRRHGGRRYFDPFGGPSRAPARSAV